MPNSPKEIKKNGSAKPLKSKRMAELSQLFSRDDRWLIMTNADPDALGSAMALKRIMAHETKESALAHVNEIKRPDNLAMIRYLRIPTKRLEPWMLTHYNRFALVDSQPHHNQDFQDINFSIVIDHHPRSAEFPVKADYADIRPEYGATSSILVEYLAELHIRPGQYLATSLVFGIKADTSSFERHFIEPDLRAFKRLSAFYSPELFRAVSRSDFKLGWLGYFSVAISRMRLRGHGLYAFMGWVPNADILVILADFFMRVEEITWDAVAGVCDDTLIVVFRSVGNRDVGRMASSCFASLGSAGGHKVMARAEIPLANIGEECRDLEQFVLRRLSGRRGGSDAPAEGSSPPC